MKPSSTDSNPNHLHWKEMSRDSILRVHSLSTEVGLVNTILEFARSIVFSAGLRQEFTGVDALPVAMQNTLADMAGAEFSKYIEDEWTTRMQLIFRDKEVFGFAVVRYLYGTAPVVSPFSDSVASETRDTEEGQSDSEGDADGPADEGSGTDDLDDKQPPKKRKRETKGTTKKSEKARVERIIGFEVLRPWQIRLQYYYDPVTMKYEYRVFNNAASILGASSANALLPNTPIPNTRVLVTENAMAHAPEITSSVSQVAYMIVAYQNLLVQASVIMRRLAFPDWGTRKKESATDRTALDGVSYPSADGALGHVSVMMAAEKLADDQVDAKVAINTATDQYNQNESKHVTHAETARLNPTALGSMGSNTPVFAERTPLVLPPNTEVFSFDAAGLPSGLPDLLRTYCNEIGAPFGLNHAIIIGEVRGNSTHGQALVSHAARARLYAEERHRSITWDLRVIFNDVYADFMSDLRARAVQVGSANPLVLPSKHWTSVDISFKFQRRELGSYDDVRKLFEDGVVNAQTYVSLSHTLFGISDPQGTPEENEERVERAWNTRAERPSVSRSPPPPPNTPAPQKKKEDAIA